MHYRKQLLFAALKVMVYCCFPEGAEYTALTWRGDCICGIYVCICLLSFFLSVGWTYLLETIVHPNAFPSARQQSWL